MTIERRKRFLYAIANRIPSITILLENVFDPHNIAAIFRTCDSMGIQEIHVLQTKNKKIPNKWSKKTSSSANKWLNIIQHDHLDTCMSKLRKKYQTIITTSLSSLANIKTTELYHYNFPHSCVIVFGNETKGLSDDILRYSDTNIIIPQKGLIRSLNISVACAIIMYEIYRQMQDYNQLPYLYNLEQYKAAYETMLCQWKVF